MSDDLREKKGIPDNWGSCTPAPVAYWIDDITAERDRLKQIIAEVVIYEGRLSNKNLFPKELRMRIDEALKGKNNGGF